MSLEADMVAAPATTVNAAPAGDGVPSVDASLAALEGDLARFAAVDVLQFLKLAGQSGVAEFERSGERLTVTFAHGRPLAAHTTGRSVRVGDVLVHRGSVAPAVVQTALERQAAEPGTPIGAVLRDLGVSDAHIGDAVAEVFRRLVCLLALWPDGRFRFLPGPPAAVDDVALDVELDRVILEGVSAADSLL